VRARLRELLDGPEAAAPRALAGALFDMLADRETAPVDDLPPGDLSPEWARKLSAPFVLDPAYGTRCSTVVTITNTGALAIAERRFAPDGSFTAETERALNVGEA
jgi:uncharacterized protein with NRDE domain